MEQRPIALVEELHEYGKLTVEEQRACRDEIIKLFKRLWLCEPTQIEFVRATSGIVLFGEMLYLMIHDHKHEETP